MTSAPAEPPHSIGAFVRGYEVEQRLRAFRCSACGATTATWGVSCSRCGAGPLEEATLPERGKVVSGTIVAVASEEFVNETPYAYVLVELDGGSRLSGWMPGVTMEAEIAPGTPVRWRASYKPGLQFERLPPEE